MDFADKAVRELTAGRVDAIAWHGPVAPDTDWHAQIEPFSHVRFEFGERIKYNGKASGGTFPSATTILRPERRVGPLPVHHLALGKLEATE